MIQNSSKHWQKWFLNSLVDTGKLISSGLLNELILALLKNHIVGIMD